MSKIARIVPSVYYARPGVTVTNDTLMYTNIDSDTYAEYSGETYSFNQIGGFDFSILPSNAIIISYSIFIKIESGTMRSYLYVYDGPNNRKSGVYMDTGAETPTVYQYNTSGITWDELMSYDLRVTTLSPARVYGIEVRVEYDLPVNKVVYGTTVLVDLTEDTVTADDLSEGITAHDASGATITGTNQRGIMVIRDSSDSHGGTVRTITSGEAQVGGMDEATLKKFIQRDTTFTDIDWPDGLTSIGEHVFASCGYFNPSSLPDTVQLIGSYAFYSCDNLALTSLPDSVSSISSRAFQSCSKLALTSLPNGIKYIDTYAFQGCTNLALTSLPDGVTGISSYAFQRCTNLALTSLPDGVTSIGSYAFSACTSLTSISCIGIITQLDNSAFNGNSTYQMALSSVSFPNMALTSNISTVFGSSTAANACQQLAFCDIGSTVGIAANAFANCYALQTLVLRKTASVCTLANVSAFLNTPMRGYNSLTGTVYVPQALIESYKTATNWSTLYNDGTVTFAAIEGSQYERE